jgi:hypothetical protein
MTKGRGPCIDAVNGISFPEGNIQASSRVEGHGPGAVQRCPFERRTVWSWLPVTRSSKRLDDARGELYASDAMIANVADEEEPVARVNRDAVRLTQLCRRRRPTIP